MRSHRGAGAVALFLLVAGSAASAGGQVDEALHRAYRDPELQLRLPPDVTLEQNRSAEAELDAFDAVLRRLSIAGIPLHLLALFGIAIAVVALLLGLLWLLVRLRERRDLTAPDGGPDEPVLDSTLLADADALAREGRYAEAIHLLLLRTFEVLTHRMGSRLAPGMTAREAVTRLALPPPARPALADLVQAVETTNFAGRSASHADYRRCAERFTVLQSALAGARA
jgi:Domain of unknown function (DUF4129)